MDQVKKAHIRLWSENRGGKVVNLKVSVIDDETFTFDAWNVESGEHVGVHSPHAHRPYFHLQTRKGKADLAAYQELPSGKAFKFYAQAFERAARKIFGINVWKVFS